MKATEYGGADTRKSQGIQPHPDHQVVGAEALRLMYATDPSDINSSPDALQPKYTTPNDGIAPPPPVQQVAG